MQINEKNDFEKEWEFVELMLSWHSYNGAVWGFNKGDEDNLCVQILM